MIDLSGKHVLVVGGSRGIGAETARKAARAGASVSLTYRDRRDAADALVAEIEANGGRALAVQCDVANEPGVNQAVNEVVARLGSLHGLVVSAGIFELKPLGEMTLDFWRRTIDTNLTGTFLTVKAAVPHLRKNGGSIVIYTSTAGQSGSGGASAYSVSKGGQIMFMRSMAQELASDRIRVNCIAPAWTDTDMAAPHVAGMGRETMAGKFPLGRIGESADVANAACFLLSDLAEFITGTTMTVDGGMAMRG